LELYRNGVTFGHTYFFDLSSFHTTLLWFIYSCDV